MPDDKDQQQKQQQIYDEGYSQAAYSRYRLEYWMISYVRRIFTALHLDKGDIFLDMGSGAPGYSVIEAARRNIESIAVDLSVEAMKRCNSNAKNELSAYAKLQLCHFIVASATHLPLKNSSVSKVACIGVLEHILDDKKAISEIGQVIRKKGEAFILVPNAYKRIFPLLALPYRLWDPRQGHLRHYSAEDLIVKFAKSGFFASGIFYTAHLPKLLQIVLSYLFGWKRRAKTEAAWWRLESLDLRTPRLASGLQLTVHFTKSG